MAKRKRSAGALAKRRKRKSPHTIARKSNPPILEDLKNTALPGFASYVSTKLLARIIYQVTQNRMPKAGKHAAAVSAAGAFLAVWFLGHRIKPLKKYHDGAVIGSAIAAMQIIVRTYFPDKYSWIVGDYLPSPEGQVAAQQTPQIPQSGFSMTPDDDLGALDDYTDEDPPHPDNDDVDSFLSELGDDADGLGSLQN